MSKDFFEGVESSFGESQIYLGTKFLFLIAKHMQDISIYQKEALATGGNTLWGWLNALKQFYDLVENQMGIENSDTEIDFYEYVSIHGKLLKKDIKIKEKNKYELWFGLIEDLLEKNQRINDGEISQQLKYNNDKKIMKELGNCQRALYRDANRKHLIMPGIKENMKDLAKQDWIDRDPTKIFE